MGKKDDLLDWQKERKDQLDEMMVEYNYKKNNLGNNIRFLSFMYQEYCGIIGM